MIEVIVTTALCIALGTFAGFGAIYIFNKMPASWLCDYGQEPSREIADPHIQRIKGYPWRWIYAAGFSCLLVRLAFFDVQFAVAGIFACWALLIIGLADLKYMIIPDQFVIMLGLSAVGFVPFHEEITDPLFGALCGGGVMLLVSILGSFAFKKEVMGFGDIKLFACIGLILGLKGTLTVLMGSSLLSGAVAALGLASGKYKKTDEKPLGPYICGCGAVYIFVIWPFLL